MIYVACPYNDTDPDVVQYRMDVFADIMCQMLLNDMVPVSPLLNHFVIEDRKVPLDWQFWTKYSFTLLHKCSELHVLCLEGWDSSEGVLAEIALAQNLGLPITYIEE